VRGYWNIFYSEIINKTTGALMKKIFFPLALVILFFTGSAFGQLRIGYVDSDAIMDNYPDAQDARQRLDVFIQEWQAELTKLENQWKAKFDDYEKRKLIMTDQTRSEVESDLIKLEQQIADFREKKFGTNGELFQKQDELMKPIQNKIFNAIQTIAEEDNLDFVFDRSGDILLLYAKAEYDITNKIIAMLQIN
jgi:outer membrane protein